jgi:tetratricopeptide (TPR) repeat protein
MMTWHSAGSWIIRVVPKWRRQPEGKSSILQKTVFRYGGWSFGMRCSADFQSAVSQSCTGQAGGQFAGLGRLVFLALLWSWTLFGSSAAEPGSGTNEVVRLRSEGAVEVAPAGSQEWAPASDNQLLHPGDRVRTGRNSRALVESSRLGRFRIRESSEFIFRPPSAEPSRPWLNILKGFFYFFNRDQSIEVQFHGRLASATTRGTDFLVHVAHDQRVEVTVFDGEVDLHNQAGTLTLLAGEAGEAAPASIPKRIPGRLDAVSRFQWCLYYPVVLWLNDASLSSPELAQLESSLNAYRAGAIDRALRLYPESREPRTDSERAYLAALVLASGEVSRAEQLLNGAKPDFMPRRALTRLVAAVQGRELPDAFLPRSASEWMAQSYYLQSRSEVDLRMLEGALAAARAAATNAPDFGAAWARLAELEFSFGRTATASAALDRALTLSPENADALATKGYLLAAQNRVKGAEDVFTGAINADPGLANAWLGRGLCRFRQGDVANARQDLLTAAALEPQRALLRSYLGKAFAETGEQERATRELSLARQLEPRDPTSWLYSALLKQQENRINEAITDLEEATRHNDDRSLFRSRLLLDQDRAVASVNLASIYRDAGMPDVSLREAVRAESYDYANASAHLFVSDSFGELRDPTRFNLRYETVWFGEYLLANLLSPVGAGRLSQHVSQQEYAKLFERDGLGLANSTLGRTDGQVRELASQYGTFKDTSWSLDLDYQHNDGVRHNNDLDRIEWYSTFKQQLSPNDTLLALIKYQDYCSGDNFQYYDPSEARPAFRFDEWQHPIILGGFHHEWSPGIHSVLLGGLLQNEQHITDQSAPQLLLLEDPSGNLEFTDSVPLDVDYRSELEIYTGEFNQIVQREYWLLVAGGRYQSGQIETRAKMDNPPQGMAGLFLDPAADTKLSEDFERITGYAYLTVKPWEPLLLTAGLAYDQVTAPANFRNPPITPGTETRSDWGPKAAIVWSPVEMLTLRGAYAQSLGGASLDESYRLEPTHLVGFPQTFRTLISESIVGSVTAPQYEIYGAAADLKPAKFLYAGVEAAHLSSDVRRQIGVFTLENSTAPFVTASTPEHLKYEETIVAASLNRLFGEYLTAGLRYAFTHAHLNTTLTAIPQTILPSAQRSEEADLHHTTLQVVFNHPSGLFARTQLNWYFQQNDGYSPARDDENLVQVDLVAGYRFARRRAELSAGILNISDADYRLNPLTTYCELPRERTFFAQLKFEF